MNLVARQNVQLTELNNVKNKFLGIAAHDLRNPLSVFKGYFGLFRIGALGALSDQQKDVLDRMNEQSD
ncbi:histidine kinase dimerization/phospho-acceptor domain-containing protein [Candidatus Sumerlaeota bacterium]